MTEQTQDGQINVKVSRQELILAIMTPFKGYSTVMDQTGSFTCLDCGARVAATMLKEHEHDHNITRQARTMLVSMMDSMLRPAPQKVRKMYRGSAPKTPPPLRLTDTHIKPSKG